MQDKSNKNEFIITVVASIAAFLAGTGIIDVDLGKVVDTAGQVKTIAEGIDTSSVRSIVEGVYRIVCLLIGGSIIISYLKYKSAKEQKVVIQKAPEPEKKEEILLTEDGEMVIEDEDIPGVVLEDPGADTEYGLK